MNPQDTNNYQQTTSKTKNTAISKAAQYLTEKISGQRRQSKAQQFTTKKTITPKEIKEKEYTNKGFTKDENGRLILKTTEMVRPKKGGAAREFTYIRASYDPSSQTYIEYTRVDNAVFPTLQQRYQNGEIIYEVKTTYTNNGRIKTSKIKDYLKGTSRSVKRGSYTKSEDGTTDYTYKDKTTDLKTGQTISKSSGRTGETPQKEEKIETGYENVEEALIKADKKKTTERIYGKVFDTKNWNARDWQEWDTKIQNPESKVYLAQIPNDYTTLKTLWQKPSIFGTYINPDTGEAENEISAYKAEFNKDNQIIWKPTKVGVKKDDSTKVVDSLNPMDNKEENFIKEFGKGVKENVYDKIAKPFGLGVKEQVYDELEANRVIQDLYSNARDEVQKELNLKWYQPPPEERVNEKVIELADKFEKKRKESKTYYWWISKRGEEEALERIRSGNAKEYRDASIKSTNSVLAGTILFGSLAQGALGTTGKAIDVGADFYFGKEYLKNLKESGWNPYQAGAGIMDAIPPIVHITHWTLKGSTPTTFKNAPETWNYLKDINPYTRKMREWSPTKPFHKVEWTEQVITPKQYAKLIKYTEGTQKLIQTGKVKPEILIKDLRIKANAANLPKSVTNAVIKYMKNDQQIMGVGSQITKGQWLRRKALELFEEKKINEETLKELIYAGDKEIINMASEGKLKQYFNFKEYTKGNKYVKAQQRAKMLAEQQKKYLKKTQQIKKYQLPEEITNLRPEYQAIFNRLSESEKKLILKGSVTRAVEVFNDYLSGKINKAQFDELFETIKPKIEKIENGKEITKFKDIDTEATMTMTKKKAKMLLESITEELNKIEKHTNIEENIRISDPKLRFLDKDTTLQVTPLTEGKIGFVNRAKRLFGKADIHAYLEKSTSNKDFLLMRAVNERLKTINKELGYTATNPKKINIYPFDLGISKIKDKIINKIKNQYIEVEGKQGMIGYSQSIKKNILDALDVDELGKMPKQEAYLEIKRITGELAPFVDKTYKNQRNLRTLTNDIWGEILKRDKNAEIAARTSGEKIMAVGDETGDHLQVLDKIYDLYPEMKKTTYKNMVVDNYLAELNKQFQAAIQSGNKDKITRIALLSQRVTDAGYFKKYKSQLINSDIPRKIIAEATSKGVEIAPELKIPTINDRLGLIRYKQAVKKIQEAFSDQPEWNWKRQIKHEIKKRFPYDYEKLKIWGKEKRTRFDPTQYINQETDITQRILNKVKENPIKGTNEFKNAINKLKKEYQQNTLIGKENLKKIKNEFKRIEERTTNINQVKEEILKSKTLNKLIKEGQNIEIKYLANYLTSEYGKLKTRYPNISLGYQKYNQKKEETYPEYQKEEEYKQSKYSKYPKETPYTKYTTTTGTYPQEQIITRNEEEKKEEIKIRNEKKDNRIINKKWETEGTTGYQPIMLAKNKQQTIREWYPTYKEAVMRAMQIMDETAWNQATIRKDQVRPENLSRAKEYRKTYKFKRTGNTYKEKRYYRFDTKQERRKSFNIIPFLYPQTG